MARKGTFTLGPTIHKMALTIGGGHGLFVKETLLNLELSAFLKDHPEYADQPIAQARRLVRKYFKIIRPRASSPGGFYHPQRLVPAAPGERCFMQVIGPAQLDFWRDQDRAAKKRADDAHELKEDFWTSRLREFTVTRLATLDQVEKASFGYVDPPVPTVPDEIFDEGEDDDES